MYKWSSELEGFNAKWISRLRLIGPSACLTRTWSMCRVMKVCWPEQTGSKTLAVMTDLPKSWWQMKYRVHIQQTNLFTVNFLAGSYNPLKLANQNLLHLSPVWASRSTFSVGHKSAFHHKHDRTSTETQGQPDKQPEGGRRSKSNNPTCFHHWSYMWLPAE